jgi:hypothetical protein
MVLEDRLTALELVWVAWKVGLKELTEGKA